MMIKGASVGIDDCLPKGVMYARVHGTSLYLASCYRCVTSIIRFVEVNCWLNTSINSLSTGACLHTIPNASKPIFLLPTGHCF